MQPQQFIKLPAGSIQPEGWLKQQMILQKDGLNGQKQSGILAAGSYACLNRKWKDKDEVVLNVPMDYAVREWQVNKNSVSVNYGPLTLSLKIQEEYKQLDSRKTAVWDSKWQEGAARLRITAFPTAE